MSTEPKSTIVATMLTSLGIARGCMVAMHERDRNVYLSARNIPKTDLRLVEELTAYEVLLRKKLVFTKPAFERLQQRGQVPEGE